MSTCFDSEKFVGVLCAALKAGLMVAAHAAWMKQMLALILINSRVSPFVWN